MSKRSDYIHANYSLSCAAGIWTARSPYDEIDGPGFGPISGPNRAEVVREARCRWGHFNFDDEARAFDAIFKVIP